MDEYLSVIKMFGCNFAPRGWAFCQGQQMSIAQNSALFALLGTTFGGNGQTTFGLPDFRGRVPIGQGSGPGLSGYTPGQMGGAESVTLTTNQLPAHTHAASATSQLFAEAAPGSSQNPQGRMLAGGTNFYADEAPSQNRQLSSQSVVTTVTNAVAGGNQAFDIRQPYVCVNVCICIEGLFPSRS